jgi:hypothetical protein
MAKRRAPWWIFAAAAPLVLFGVVTFYADVSGPEQPGWTGGESQGGVLIQAVRPNSPAARSGLEPGDRLLSWNGLPVDRGCLAVRLLHVEAGRTYQLTVQRAGEIKTLPLTFGRRTWSYWRDRRGQCELLTFFAAVAHLILAFVLVSSRPRDPAALWGAVFLAVNFVGANVVVHEALGVGVFHAYEALPAFLGGVVIVTSALATGTSASTCFTFFALFPRRLFSARWIWAVVWAPALPSTMILLYWTWLRVRVPDSFTGLGRSAALANGTTPAYVLAALFVAFLNYGRLADPNERRRLRVVMVGLGISGAAVLYTLSSLALMQFGRGLVQRLATAALASPLFVVALLFYPAFAIAMAYAILRHRLFDVRIMIRQGLQYAAARGLLLSLVPLLGGVLVADLLLHGDQPLVSILGQRG